MKVNPVAALLILTLPAPAAYVSRIWRTQDGLPENRVRALAQTPDGYLWVGTTGGLARFDGVRFVTYTRFNTPAMTEDNVRSLAVGRDGSLWVATDGGGLLHLKDGRFVGYGPGQGLASDFVAAVLEDRQGSIWAATNRGLYRKTGERFSRVDGRFQLRNQAFFSLAETREGTVLAGGQAGLFQQRGELEAPAGEPEEVFRVRPLRNGAWWLATNHGIRTTGMSQPDLRPLEGKAVSALSEDRAGNMWVGTLGDGLQLFRGAVGAPQRVTARLPDQTVLAILEDREEGIWVGTADGLARLTEPDVEVLDQSAGLANDNVMTVACGKAGDVWLTTVTGAAYRYAQGRVEPFRLPGPASELRLLGVFEAPNGDRWFGTDSQGAVLWRGGVARRFTMRDGLRNNGIQFFHAGPGGEIWIGTTSGISRWDGVKMRNYYVEDGLSYGWVRSIAEDANGDLLIGTDRGLNRVRQGKFVTDASFAPLARDRVWSIFRDHQGTVWIGTRNNGLVRLRDGQAKRITSKDGLLSNSVFQVVGAGDGRLWMSGPSGISSASLADLNAAAEGRLATPGALSYRVSGGQESAQINGGVQGAGCVAANGEVWFPGVKGAVHLKSRRPPIRRHMPVRVESVLVDEVAHAPNAEIAVEPGRHRVRIEFTSCTLRAPEAVTFRYKLEGYDAGWVTATGTRTAIYDNLPPAQYRFQVVAHDESPGENTSQASVALMVKPYFYQTAWFYGLVALAAVAGLGVVLYYRERRTRAAYALRLEERTRIAREMHDTLVQGCVGVSTLIEAAVGSADPQRMAETLDNARVHLRLTIDEARQALTDLRHDSFDEGLPGALRELVDGVRGPSVSLQVEGQPVPLPDAASRSLLLVAREAIRNAVTHGAPTSIEVSLLYEKAVLELDIQDNGRGFSPPESQLANAGHFGILGMRERMEQIGGTLEVSSAPSAGTAISARLPLR